MSGPSEPVATWVLPIMVILGLLLLPFLDRSQDRRQRSRPVAMLTGAFFLVIVFTLQGISIRDFQEILKLDPSVARGKLVFTQNHCMACHDLHGEGGKGGAERHPKQTKRKTRCCRFSASHCHAGLCGG